MFGLSYDVEPMRNSVQAAAHMLIKGGVRRPTAASPSHRSEAGGIARGILQQQDGPVALLRALAAISPQLETQIEANALPFLTAPKPHAACRRRSG
jgi:hypothetical protein